MVGDFFIQNDKEANGIAIKKWRNIQRKISLETKDFLESVKKIITQRKLAGNSKKVVEYIIVGLEGEELRTAVKEIVDELGEVGSKMNIRLLSDSDNGLIIDNQMLNIVIDDVANGGKK